MANVLFTRTSDPNSKPVTDGQLIFDTSGNGKMYLDNGTDRLEMGGALTVDATLSKTSTNPVQNKAVAGVMLDTLSDIGNVTSKGFLTDALAVKQLNTNVNELNNSFVSNIYVGSDGKLHKVQGGADSVLPFSSNKRYSYSWTSSNNEQKTLTLEIEPKYIAFTISGIAQNATLYDVEKQEYIINTTGANIIASVNGKVVTINTYHGASQVNYLNYW